jgi:hypothetical protein
VKLPFVEQSSTRAEITPIDGIRYVFDGIVETAEPLDRKLLDILLDDFEVAAIEARQVADGFDEVAIARTRTVVAEKRAILRGLLMQSA